MIIKTEVMVFGGTTGTPPVALGSSAQYRKPSVTNLGLKWTLSLSLTVRLIKAVVKSSFFHLRQLAKIKPILLRQHFETVIHALLPLGWITVMHGMLESVGPPLPISRWYRRQLHVFYLAHVNRSIIPPF